MLKNKLDYKLINLALIALIAFLVYTTSPFWGGILNKAINITIPFLIAFAIAYALHPFLTKMIDNKIPKWAGVTIIVLLILSIISLVVYLVTTVLLGQLSSLFSNIIGFVTKLESGEWELNLSILETDLTSTFKTILNDVGNSISSGAVSIFNTSLAIISKVFIIFAAFIYFLIDMDKIREEIKFFFKKKSKKTYNYVKSLDDSMRNYLSGLVQVIFITLIEYTLAYTIIGHPNALLLGFLAAVCTLIPYFGGIMVNIIASITAFVVSPGMLIKTIITFVILSSLDSYVINPAVYGKTNKIHPLVTIIALFAGGIIFGIKGVFISFPLTIIIVTTYRYYKEDITEKLKK